MPSRKHSLEQFSTDSTARKRNLYRDDGSARGRLIAGLFPVEYLVEKRVVDRVESR